MAQLIYSMITSLDGYTADADGNFDWATPDDEVFGFVNELERPVGTYLYGRRMYETMRYWETESDGPDDPPVAQEFKRIWLAADKVVYSTTLDSVSTARTRLEREFDPDAVRAMKGSLDHDMSVSGPNLAAEALRMGLVDELQLFVVPAIVGGGTSVLPSDFRVALTLIDQHAFAGGFIYLHYRVEM